MTKILQWNCQSIKGKLTEFEFRSSDFCIILLSETWIKDNDRLLLRNYDTIKYSRTSRAGGGAAILIRNGVRYVENKRLTNVPQGLECCAVDVDCNNEKLLIVSCYRPPDCSISEQAWTLFLGQFQGKFILGGDLNAHHIAWGSAQSSHEGVNLFEAILRTDAVCLNSGTVTRINSRGNKGSAIDITLASPNIAMNADWEVLSDSWGSDHFPISIEIAGSLTMEM